MFWKKDLFCSLLSPVSKILWIQYSPSFLLISSKNWWFFFLASRVCIDLEFSCLNKLHWILLFQNIVVSHLKNLYCAKLENILQNLYFKLTKSWTCLKKYLPEIQAHLSDQVNIGRGLCFWEKELKIKSLFFLFCFVFCCCFVVIGMEPRASHMLRKCSTTEIQLQSLKCIL
jgi:hypothetical protein